MISTVVYASILFSFGRAPPRNVSNQPQYSLLWRVIEAEVVPLSEAEGIGQIVWSPLSQGVLTGKYLPGGATPPEGSRALGIEGGEMSWLLRDEVLKPVQVAVECYPFAPTRMHWATTRTQCK